MIKWVRLADTGIDLAWLNYAGIPIKRGDALRAEHVPTWAVDLYKAQLGAGVVGEERNNVYGNSRVPSAARWANRGLTGSQVQMVADRLSQLGNPDQALKAALTVFALESTERSLIGYLNSLLEQEEST